MDWLNTRTDEGINLFGVEIELWKIGDSLTAPKFNVVSRPNDWQRTVKKGATDVSEYKLKQLRFWTAFQEAMIGSPMKGGSPKPHHYIHFNAGLSGSYYSISMSRWDFVTSAEKPGEYRVQLVFSGSRAKDRFEVLEGQKGAIESALGMKLDWFKPEKGNCRILTRHDFDFEDEKEWPEQFKWMRRTVEAFEKVFAPYLKTIDKEQERVIAALA